MKARTPRVGGQQSKGGKHGRRGADGSMRGRTEQRFDQIGQRRAADDEQPGDAIADLALSQVTEPDASNKIRQQMRAVQMQRERRPGAPPLSALNKPRVELAELKGIEAP